MNQKLVLLKSIGLLALLSFLLGIYWFAIRSGQLHWGATEAEIASAMPGDELVHDPTFKATRAITIDGTPEAIWPWLVQMGYGRAGFYGYDLFEGLGSPSGFFSATSILPQLQQLRVGDPLPIFYSSTMQVERLDSNQVMVWVGGPSYSSMAFTWELAPLDGQHTRLISRVQFRHLWNNPFQAGQIAFTEFLDHLAIRKILMGVKGRVEGTREPLGIQAGEIATFILGALGFAVALLLFLVRRNWQVGWVAAAWAGAVALFALYAHAPFWIAALLEGSVLAILVEHVFIASMWASAMAWFRKYLK